MAKFTPGPWTITEFLPDENGNNLITATYQEVRAGLGFIDDEPGGTGFGFSLSACMRREDANLIAASPEMYEALKKCQLQLLQCGSDHEYVSEALAEAQIALAKAEGGK